MGQWLEVMDKSLGVYHVPAFRVLVEGGVKKQVGNGIGVIAVAGDPHELYDIKSYFALFHGAVKGKPPVVVYGANGHGLEELYLKITGRKFIVTTSGIYMETGNTSRSPTGQEVKEAMEIIASFERNGKIKYTHLKGGEEEDVLVLPEVDRLILQHIQQT